VADGALLWEQRYQNGFASAVAVDGSGNVVVTGNSGTVKYAAAGGALLWEQRHNSVEGQAVVVDASGNVVVAATSYTAPNDNGDFTANYYTAKYAGADGALLWEQRYNGPAGYDFAAAMALDASGNVVVTGSSRNLPDFSYDYYTAKYAAADGALLWEQRYNGPTNSLNFAAAVAVDDSANVVVTGSSWNADEFGNVISDYYTAKYAAADGALLWEQRYNGPANGNDVAGGPRSLALGPNGMVATTGSSEGVPGSYSYDYATVVYHENQPPVITCPTNTVANATGPWSTNATLTAVTNGIVEYIDTNAPPGSAFYRTAAMP